MNKLALLATALALGLGACVSQTPPPSTVTIGAPEQAPAPAAPPEAGSRTPALGAHGCLSYDSAGRAHMVPCR